MTFPIIALPEMLTDKCTKSRADRILKGQYGRGFKQVAKDGLNTAIDSWNLIYAPLKDADLVTVRSFIDTVNCDGIFYWTPFGESTAKKWRIVENSIKEKMWNIELIEISFTIEQDFTLGT